MFLGTYNKDTLYGPDCIHCFKRLYWRKRRNTGPGIHNIGPYNPWNKSIAENYLPGQYPRVQEYEVQNYEVSSKDLAKLRAYDLGEIFGEIFR